LWDDFFVEWVVDEVGVVEDGVATANTGPASSIKPTSGTSLLNTVISI
jgi:hypothetical protein